MKYDFEDWKKQIEENAKTILRASENIFKECVEEFEKEVAIRTPEGDPTIWSSPPPKDYEPGTLRKGWFSTYSSDGKYAEVINKVPYGPVIEYGSWSTQAPHGMMRITQKYWPSIVNRIAKTKKTI